MARVGPKLLRRPPSAEAVAGGDAAVELLLGGRLVVAPEGRVDADVRLVFLVLQVIDPDEG
ncbi:hypothetical protein D3C83_249750 [compost metagenome]